MEDQLITDQLAESNTFSPKPVKPNSNAFPDDSHEKGLPRLNSDLFEKDEESEFLINDSMFSQASVGKEPRTGKKLVYFLMFFNICRSFIAIGVLAIPFSLSKIGTRPSL